MYVTTHMGDDHVHLTLEHGFHAGTWEVRYEQAGVCRVRSPEGHVQLLKLSEPWIGDLRDEFVELMRRIAPRAVMEALRRERAGAPKATEEARGETIAAWAA